jgi:hypothetical protein
MREARYPVPQPPVLTAGPARLIFTLPPTLPVRTPLAGIPRDPFTAPPPKLILVKAEIVSQGVLQGRIQPLLAVRLPSIFGVPAKDAVIAGPPVQPLQGIRRPAPPEGPPSLFGTPATDIVSTGIPLQGLLPLLPTVGPPRIFGFPATETVSRGLPLQGRVQLLITVGAPALFGTPAVDVVSQVILSGLAQNIPTVGLPSIFGVPAVDTVSTGVLQGLIQRALTVGPPSIFGVPAVDVVSSPAPLQLLLQGLAQLLPTVGAPSIFGVPAVDIVSQVILAGRSQDSPTVRLPFLFPFTAPVVAVLPIQIPLQGRTIPGTPGLGPSSITVFLPITQEQAAALGIYIPTFRIRRR